MLSSQIEDKINVKRNVNCKILNVKLFSSCLRLKLFHRAYYLYAACGEVAS